MKLSAYMYVTANCVLSSNLVYWCSSHLLLETVGGAFLYIYSKSLRDGDEKG